MAKLPFKLNGISVESEEGIMVLAAAEQHGVVIPTLCNDPRLKPTAACRLCLVEIEGAKGPMPACATALSAGMVINTNTENIFKLRQTALELLLSDHYGDCIAPCKQACPAGIDIQGYIAHIANGQYREALKLIKESNPLPLVCGRVCPRFCEKKCRRNIVDEPVAINFLKRFVADLDLNSENMYQPDIKIASGHKVAIIGGVPSGLTAAYYLAIEGHSVTIFDSSPQLGGMLRYGIPEYRLPKVILNKEIDSIVNLCKEVHLSAALGRDFTIDSLKREGYEAIYIALGAQSSQKMQVEGEDLPGVISGIDFLGDVILNKKIELGGRVAIVGGGNTAIDAARTALRFGAQQVSIVYRRSRDEMPANDEEIEQAEIEGVKFILLVAPQKIVEKNGKAGSLVCLRMKLGEADGSGRRKPEPIPGSEFSIEVDTIIAAIGQSVDASGIPQEAIDNKRTIGINKNTMEISLPGVFSGGDCVTGPATAVEAIGAGKKAAISISQYLRGQLITAATRVYNCSKGELNDIDITDYNNVPCIPRAVMPALSLQKREHNFEEVDLGFTGEMAINESTRCLSCGCQDVFECKLRQLGTEYKVEDKHYVGKKHHLPIVENEHPYVVRDENKCILCGRCVRICSEVEGISALGFINRGFNTVVGPAINMPLSETMCESCGQCVSTCPTGAFQDRINLVKQGPWKTDVISSVCPYCSIGCNLELNITGNKLVTITSPLDSPVNNGNLCRRGKYDCLRVNNTMRLPTPLVKQGDKLVETNWIDVMEMARKELLTINKDTGNKVAVLASGMLTNEESYLIQKMARTALGTNNIVGMTGAIFAEGYVKSTVMNTTYCSLDEIRQSDLIITIGGDITQSYPIVALKVREAAQGSAKLITISPETTRLASLSKVDLKVNARTTLALLRAMLNYIINYNLVDHEFIKSKTNGFEQLVIEMEKYPFQDIVELFWVKPAKIIEAIHLYIQAKRPVILVNTDNIKTEELALLSDLALITGNMNREGSGIITLRTPGNAQGLLDMGMHPGYLPGFKSMHIDSVNEKFEVAWKKKLPQTHGKDTEDIIEGIKNGEFEGLLVFGMDAAEKLGKDIYDNVKFSLLMSNTIPEESPYPSVVVPMASFAESNGTFTNCEHRIQYLNRAILPMSCKQNWEIIAALSSALGYSMKYTGIQEIRAEISRLVPGYKLDSTNIDGKGISPENCDVEHGALHLENSIAGENKKVLKAVKI